MPLPADLIGAIARLGDAVREYRVIDQELHRIDAARLRALMTHVVEEAGHAQWIVAGARHGADADAVGLEFAGAGVVDLMLNCSALSAQDSSLDCIGGAATGCRGWNPGRSGRCNSASDQ